MCGPSLRKSPPAGFFGPCRDVLRSANSGSHAVVNCSMAVAIGCAQAEAAKVQCKPRGKASSDGSVMQEGVFSCHSGGNVGSWPATMPPGGLKQSGCATGGSGVAASDSQRGNAGGSSPAAFQTRVLRQLTSMRAWAHSARWHAAYSSWTTRGLAPRRR